VADLTWVKVLIDPVFGQTSFVACNDCACIVSDADDHKARHHDWHGRLLDAMAAAALIDGTGCAT